MPGEAWAHPFACEGKSTPLPSPPCMAFSSLFMFLCCIHELANQLVLVGEILEGCRGRCIEKTEFCPGLVIRMFNSWLGTAGLREGARARVLSPSG